jgi:hypothetical protein
MNDEKIIEEACTKFSVCYNILTIEVDFKMALRKALEKKGAKK